MWFGKSEVEMGYTHQERMKCLEMGFPLPDAELAWVQAVQLRGGQGTAGRDGGAVGLGGGPGGGAGDPRGCGQGPLAGETWFMKVSIIGGGGLVGSMTAFALQCGGVASHLCVIDANQDMAAGQALDLLHGASLSADQRISAGSMD